MKTHYLIHFVVLICTACGLQNARLDNDVSVVVSRVIGTCSDELEYRGYDRFPAPADRVYVFERDSLYRVIYAYGSIGNFERRDPDYRSVYSCGVLATDELEVVSLSAPLQDPLIVGGRGILPETPIESKVYWFEITGGVAVFLESGKFNHEGVTGQGY